MSTNNNTETRNNTARIIYLQEAPPTTVLLLLLLLLLLLPLQLKVLLILLILLLLLRTPTAATTTMTTTTTTTTTMMTTTTTTLITTTTTTTPTQPRGRSRPRSTPTTNVPGRSAHAYLRSCTTSMVSWHLAKCQLCALKEPWPAVPRMADESVYMVRFPRASLEILRQRSIPGMSRCPSRQTFGKSRFGPVLESHYSMVPLHPSITLFSQGIMWGRVSISRVADKSERGLVGLSSTKAC